MGQRFTLHDFSLGVALIQILALAGIGLGVYFVYGIIESAVKSGVKKALRDHHYWLRDQGPDIER
jgi:hypothetical protein